MPDYVIVDGDTAVNAIVAESKEAAEEATGLSVIEPVNYEPWIGWTKVNGEWVNPNPLPPPNPDSPTYLDRTV